MSRRGNCLDNAVAESFFSSLKKERIRKRIYKTRDLTRADVFDYIEAFYNRTRCHSHLGGVSPEEFERTSIWGSSLSTVAWEVHFVVCWRNRRANASCLFANLKLCLINMQQKNIEKFKSLNSIHNHRRAVCLIEDPIHYTYLHFIALLTHFCFKISRQGLSCLAKNAAFSSWHCGRLSASYVN